MLMKVNVLTVGFALVEFFKRTKICGSIIDNRNKDKWFYGFFIHAGCAGSIIEVNILNFYNF
jgi:hypothetical protein